MKMGGRKAGVNSAVVVFERPEGRFVFHLKAVKDRSEFNKICPPIQPEVRKLANGETQPVLSNTYKEAIRNQNGLFMKWLLLQGLKDTPDLEWEKVNPDDINTYRFLEEELVEFGLNDGEYIHLIEKMKEVNALDEEKLNAARESFLAETQAT